MPNFKFLGPAVWAVRCQISQSVLNFIYIDVLKKPHQNPLRSFKDISTHMDRKREATLFYNMYDL